jgi:predicted Zn-dependent peptidase
VLELIHGELDHMAIGDVSARELDLAKGHLKGSLALSLEDSASRMTRIGRGILLHDEVLSFDELVTRTEAVTLDDLERVARRVITDERVLAVVGPFEQDAFAERVA